MQSRIAKTDQPDATPGDTIAEAPEGEESAAPGEDGAPAEGEEGAQAPAADAAQEVLEMPTYDKNAMEDMAPAQRLRLNQAINKRELEERQRIIEEMIALEKEKDPDALDEDIITKVNKEIALKRTGTTMNDTMVSAQTETRRNRAPAIQLGTVLAAQPQ